MPKETSSVFLFCVDTEQYSGNFERQMCAYMTGRVGDCGVGSDDAEAAECELTTEESVWIQEHIAPQKDEDHAILRPVTIVATPGWFNTGLGGFHRENTPPDEVLREWLARWNKENRTDTFWLSLRARGPGRYPCYLSVGIYFDEVPPPDILHTLRNRARAYAVENNLTIAGFRILKQTITVTTETLHLSDAAS